MRCPLASEVESQINYQAFRSAGDGLHLTEATGGFRDASEAMHHMVLLTFRPDLRVLEIDAAFSAAGRALHCNSTTKKPQRNMFKALHSLLQALEKTQTSMHRPQCHATNFEASLRKGWKVLATVWPRPTGFRRDAILQ